jgi:hypothetical protein
VGLPVNSVVSAHLGVVTDEKHQSPFFLRIRIYLGCASTQTVHCYKVSIPSIHFSDDEKCIRWIALLTSHPQNGALNSAARRTSHDLNFGFNFVELATSKAACSRTSTLRTKSSIFNRIGHGTRTKRHHLIKFN